MTAHPDGGVVFVHRKHMLRPFMITGTDHEKLYFKRAKCSTVYNMAIHKWHVLMKSNSLIVIFNPTREEVTL